MQNTGRNQGKTARRLIESGVISSDSQNYTGRFAPSPTGPLHIGSLVAALAGFLDAKAHQGRWLVRIEDIDPPREQPGAISAILNSLEAHHLLWDGEILYQSQRSAAYQQALQELESRRLCYRCICSRQTLQDLSPESIYSGHCRHLNHGDESIAAIRLNTEKSLHELNLDPLLPFDDLIQGTQQQNIPTAVGDFVIHRKDGLFAYQLAVVVDDIFQNITHVIRGADLLDSTARQILLFQLFGAKAPIFGHVPLVLNNKGQKLSKQNLAPALNDKTPEANIMAALQLLNQHPPAALAKESLETILCWAINNWKITSV